MTSCHLVTDSDLSLLGDIYFRKLHNAVSEFVTDLDLVLDPLVCCESLFVGDAVIVDEVTDHEVGPVVVSPSV